MSRILLLSDIHFGREARNTDFLLEGQTVAGIRENDEKAYFETFIEKIKDNRIDYIVCAGDLTSQGKPLEFKACLNKLYKLANNIGVPDENVIYCMGNHDVDETLTELIFCCKQYQGFKKEYNNLDVEDKDYLKNYYCNLSHSWLYHYNQINSGIIYKDLFDEEGPLPMSGFIRKPGINFFVLNSAYLRTQDQKVNHGILNKEQLLWLDKTLDRESIAGVWNIVLLHHHPFAYEYPEIYHEIATLEEGPQFQRICAKHKGTIVLHGHCHWPMALTEMKNSWDNPVTFISAGSFSVNSGGRFNNKVENTYHIIDLLDYPDLIQLDTFGFSRVEGWRSVAEDDYNTLGPQRFFGRIPLSKEETYKLLMELPKDKTLTFNDIDLRLKYTSYKELNKYLIEIYKLQLSGSLPEGILIHS